MTVQTIRTGDGCRIAYRFDGLEDAPVLLLSNSLGTAMAMWEPQLEAFAGRFRVLRYDGRGHGSSDAPDGAYSIDRLARDAIELLDGLGIETVDFCGLSLGGMVGQALAIRAPARLRRLILANTSSHMSPASAWDSRIAQVCGKGMVALSQSSVERWFTEGFRSTRAGAGAVEATTAMLLATDPWGYAGCCAAIRDMDLRCTVSCISTPTLVIGGALDPATPPPHSEALSRAIANSQLIMLAASHLSNIEVSQEFSAACLSFLVV